MNREKENKNTLMPETVFYSRRLLLLATWAPSLEESWMSDLLMGTEIEGKDALLIWLSIQIFQISTEIITDQIQTV